MSEYIPHRLAVQVVDDNIPAGEPGYASRVDYLTSGEERLATVAADSQHNHWGVYTKADAVGAGDTQPSKRLSIDGGAKETLFRIMSERGPESRLMVSTNVDGAVPIMTFNNSNGNRSSIAHESGMTYIYNHALKERVASFQMKGQSQVNFEGNPVRGFREVESNTDILTGELAFNKSHGEMVYRDKSGAIHKL